MYVRLTAVPALALCSVPASASTVVGNTGGGLGVTTPYASIIY